MISTFIHREKLLSENPRILRQSLLFLEMDFCKKDWVGF